ncbi:ARM repeat-containing protein [Rhizodiscina lignyota]|uniref:ARM repeat-containing protein n=1 Tax=Rhizodiscina lignyota TaxID=1504668 RepID=A0A9P4IPM8_9PEZI|nr:ARM repeat-containing protein [Rhizodiscina lignyota]
MADQEEDFSSLPLTERWVHKNWKVRKEAYEAAAKEFESAQSENDPTVRTFTNDSSLWKGAVGDSNVAAQQEALGSLCSFLQIAGTHGCTRTRSLTIVPIVEKGLAATRPAAKQKALEAILLYIELDKPDPIVDELLPLLSHKLPKIIVATLSALREIYHAYGCKTVEPKPTLKILPKVFGHADKNVRAEAQNLTVEFYRWLKDAMKPLFWNELKPLQQQDLEKQFEKVKDEPPPKQERLLRSQQAVEERAVEGGTDGADVDDVGAEPEIDLEPEYMAVNVMPKIPKDLQDRIASSKWKDRKEALDDLHTAINHPKIEDGPFNDIIQALAKCMKDANIAVVTVAANCIEIFARGLKKGFSKYRNIVMSPMMERLKEKKQSVSDAIGAALDAVFAATNFGDCLEEILGFLTHKNPQVKLESTRFLIRCLRTTREAPQIPEVKSIADAATKLLTDSQEVQRSAGAEVLGTLWKIMGDRIMNPHLDGLDEIRKTKIKEFYESAEVKAKYKPKSAPPPKAAQGGFGAKKSGGGPGKKPTLGKRPTPAVAAPPAEEEPAAAPLAPRPTSRPASAVAGASKLIRPKSGIAAPGLKRPGGIPGPSSVSGGASPRRAAPPTLESEDELSPPRAAPATHKLGLAGRGLTGRPLGKPVAEPTPVSPPAPPSGLTGLGTAERAELEELRAEVESLRRSNEELKQERTKMSSQINELQNQNAQLIEDHTRDVLSIKAKETQLVRARSDAEAAEQTVLSQRREVERLKREMGRLTRGDLGPVSPPSSYTPSMTGDIYNDLNGATLNGAGGLARSRSQAGTGRPPSLILEQQQREDGIGKENFASETSVLGRNKLSPVRGPDGGLSRTSSSASGTSGAALSGNGVGAGAGGAESWKRAAEVTQNLKARIELMKAKQGLSRPH